MIIQVPHNDSYNSIPSYLNNNDIYFLPENNSDNGILIGATSVSENELPENATVISREDFAALLKTRGVDNEDLESEILADDNNFIAEANNFFDIHNEP
tara:strand:+ start:256 stop:552 length:297 start_codon:yes stop_codon:yes gene_type:complete